MIYPRQVRRLHQLSSGLLAASIVLCAADSAEALPLTYFRYEAQAQRHCPNDSVVWLDLGKARYYLKGQKRYGAGQSGSFVCRREAQDSGFRRSLFGRR